MIYIFLITKQFIGWINLAKIFAWEATSTCGELFLRNF